MMRVNSFFRVVITVVILLFLGSANLSAQNDSLIQKPFDHFLDLQANELLRQIISFDNTPDVMNPYLLKYSLRHNSTGITFNAAVGFSDSKLTDENDVETHTEMNDLRLGFGYQKRLGRIIEAGIGADYLVGRDRVETISISVQDFQSFRDSSHSTSKQINRRSGFGLHGSLRFVIAKWITVGTEFSIQYIKSEEGFNAINTRYVIPIEDFVQESATITVVNEKDDRTTSEILLPVAIFIGIRF